LDAFEPEEFVELVKLLAESDLLWFAVSAGVMGGSVLVYAFDAVWADGGVTGRGTCIGGKVSIGETLPSLRDAAEGDRAGRKGLTSGESLNGVTLAPDCWSSKACTGLDSVRAQMSLEDVAGENCRGTGLSG
jgi:hypothetical protein